MKYRNICVLGGTGFVGKPLVSRLVATGRSVLVPTRRRERHRDLLVLPGAEVVEADIHDPDTLRQLFADVDAVINLVGILNERGRQGRGFRHVHVDLPRRIVEACQAQKVRRYLHMSALNADQAKGTSWYLRTKGEAENHVHTFGRSLAVTSFRPSVIFGPHDSFINRFAGLLALPFPVFPLPCPQARFAPVYVGDVVDAFVESLEDRASFGRRFDLCGPTEYSLREIVEYIAGLTGRRRWILGLPDWASRLQATVLGILPGAPFSRDNYNSMRTDSVCPDGSGCPTTMESTVPRYLLGGSCPSRLDGFRRFAGRD